MKDFGPALFFVAIGAAIWIVDWRPFSDKVPVYIGVCAVSVKATDQCPKWTDVYEPVTYVATPTNQSVVGQLPGGIPFKLPACTVIDKNNWSCEDAPKDTPLRTRTSMVDGDYSHVLLGQSTMGLGELTPDTFPNSPRQTLQLPRWKWFHLRYGKSVPVSKPIIDPEEFYGKPTFID